MRRIGWEKDLHEFIRSRQDNPFVRGHHDCCLFAADWVQHLTGVDYAADLRGKYDDDVSALAIIEGAGGLVNLVTQLVGSPILVGLAQRGDIVATDAGSIGAIGICAGRYSAFVGHDRMYHLPTLQCSVAWSIR